MNKTEWDFFLNKEGRAIAENTATEGLDLMSRRPTDMAKELRAWIRDPTPGGGLSQPVQDATIAIGIAMIYLAIRAKILNGELHQDSER